MNRTPRTRAASPPAARGSASDADPAGAPTPPLGAPAQTSRSHPGSPAPKVPGSERDPLSPQSAVRDAGTPGPETGGRPSDRGQSPARVRAKTPAGVAHASSREATSVLPAGQAAIAAAMSEAELEEHVRELCKGLGIIRIHVYNSRGTTPGVPDDILIGPEGILWRELKTQRGKLTAAQQAMGEALAAAGQDWAVWRPASLASGAIAAELAGISAWRTRRGTRCVCDQYGSCPQGCAMCRVCGGAA